MFAGFESKSKKQRKTQAHSLAFLCLVVSCFCSTRFYLCLQGLSRKMFYRRLLSHVGLLTAWTSRWSQWRSGTCPFAYFMRCSAEHVTAPNFTICARARMKKIPGIHMRLGIKWTPVCCFLFGLFKPCFCLPIFA